MKTRKLNRGQRELRAACRFFRGETKRGASWLRAKCRNRLLVLNASRLKSL
jgi:hypothetical protein